jgi:hypothetical protein
MILDSNGQKTTVMLFNSVSFNFVLRQVHMTSVVTQNIVANFANAGSNIELNKYLPECEPL